MNISPNDEKLKKYLDELANEYKELLFSTLISQSKSIDDLSISELLRLDNEIKKPLIQDYYRQQRRRRMFFSFGLIYVFLGLFCWIFSKMVYGNFLYNKEDMFSLMSLVIGLVGLIICVYSFVSPTLSIFPKSSASRQTNYTDLLRYEVVTKWRELEGLASDISLDMSEKTPRSIIDFLIENKFIDENEYSVLKSFLKMRNSAVHSSDSYNEYSAMEIKKAISDVNTIIDKLRKIA